MVAGLTLSPDCCVVFCRGTSVFTALHCLTAEPCVSEMHLNLPIRGAPCNTHPDNPQFTLRNRTGSISLKSDSRSSCTSPL